MGINHGFTASNSQQFVIALLGWLLIGPPKIVASSLGHTGKHVDAEKPGGLYQGHTITDGRAQNIDFSSSWPFPEEGILVGKS